MAKLSNPPYGINKYAHPDRSIRETWRRKEIKKDLIGRQVYFLPFKHMDMDKVIDLTPKKLYTIIEVLRPSLINIYDDKEYELTISLSGVSAHINYFPFFIKKERRSIREL